MSDHEPVKSAWGSRERRYTRSQNKPWLVRIRGYKINEDDMSDNATLVERLREWSADPLCVDAAARIAELEADNALISKSMLARVAELEAERLMLHDKCNEANRELGGLRIDYVKLEAERDRLKAAHKAILALSQRGASDGIYGVDFREQASDLARAALSDPSGDTKSTRTT